MNNQNDLEQLCKILDNALTSDNPAMVKALRNFLLVAALIESENSNENETKNRIFGSILDEIKYLREKINQLEALHVYRTQRLPSTGEYYWDYDQYKYPYIPTTSSTSGTSNNDSSTYKKTLKDYYYNNIKIR